MKQIAESIRRFGFTNPVLVSDDLQIIAGHGRVEAAKLLGLQSVPTLALSHLSDADRRAYVLADNKLALNSGWDKEILAIELQALVELDFDGELTGFSLAEIDLVFDEASDADPAGGDESEDNVPADSCSPLSRRGDLWQLGRHKLLCGDAQCAEDFVALLGTERADLVLSRRAITCGTPSITLFSNSMPRSKTFGPSQPDQTPAARLACRPPWSRCSACR